MVKQNQFEQGFKETVKDVFPYLKQNDESKQLSPG